MGAGLSISRRARRAVAAAQEKDVTVTIATGRMLGVAQPFAEELGINVPLICYQGGLLQAPDTDEPLFLGAMDTSLVSEALAWTAPHGWHGVLYTQSEAFAARGTHPPIFHEILSREQLVWVDDLARAARTSAPVKLIFIDAPPVVDEIEAQLRRRFDGRIAIVRSHRSVVEGSPLGVSKGDALRRLAEHLSIKQSETMAVGDQDNDISMVAWAAIGVAMGDGSPGVRAVADWVAPTLAEDGAAVAIERFVLTGPQSIDRHERLSAWR